MTLHQPGRLASISQASARAGALLVLALGGSPAGAQVYASEHALAQQTANGTNFTVDYYRPVARGRVLFGTVVKWGHEWTPGANWATTIDVDHDVTLEGQPLPKGKYSIWTVPWPDAWTVILSRKARAFHTVMPAAAEEQLRLTVKPVPGPHVEMLTWSFPVVTKEGVELHLQWGTTDLPLHLGVKPSAAVLAMSAEERAKYVGVYRMTHSARSRAHSSTYTVFDSAGVLRVRRSAAPDMLYDAQYDMLKRADGTFQPLMYRNGVLVGVEPAITLVFTFDGGRATGIEVRVVDGTVVAARGVREGNLPRADTVPGNTVVVASPEDQPPFIAPTANDLSGAWLTGSADEPTIRHATVRPQCNYSPGFWLLQQQGDTVRAYTMLAHQAQGVAAQGEAWNEVLEGRLRRGVLVLGDARTGYRLRYDSASGHLRGTLNGAPFWAVPLRIVEPSGCRPVP